MRRRWCRRAPRNRSRAARRCGSPSAPRRCAAIPATTQPETTAPFKPSLPPGDLFPRKVWNRLMSREAGRAGNDYWGYGASNGLPALREAIAEHASAMRATRCSPDQVIVVTSTQQAVELAGKVLADPGDRAWAEMPGYQPVQHCLRAVGPAHRARAGGRAGARRQCGPAPRAAGASRVRHARAPVSARLRDVARTQEGAARLGGRSRSRSFSKTTTTATIATKAGRSPRCRAWIRTGA